MEILKAGSVSQAFCYIVEWHAVACHFEFGSVICAFLEYRNLLLEQGTDYVHKEMEMISGV